MEVGGKKGCGGSGRLLGKLRQHESEHGRFGAHDGAKEISLGYILKYSKRGGQQYFAAL